MTQTGIQKLSKEIRKYPVTWFFFLLITGLFLEQAVFQAGSSDNAHESLRSLGALTTLTMVRSNRLGTVQEVTQLHGQFELWDGDWWRILISGFHHADLFHLFCNGISLLWLGKLLEPRMKVWNYAFLIVSSTYISFLPEIFLEHDLVGISGGLCAMFGLLIVVRKHDEELKEIVKENLIRVMMYFLIGCVVVTELGLVRIANIAHFTGLAYGWFYGVAFWGIPDWNWNLFQRRLSQLVFCLGLLLVIPASYLLVHPEWNGRYHWYLAYLSNNERAKELGRVTAPVNDEESVHLEKAVQLDSGLSEAWDSLADYHFEKGDYHEAWKTILSGLNSNRSYENGIETAQKIWSKFSTLEGRQLATELLVEQFSDESGAWLYRLELLPGQRYSLENLRARESFVGDPNPVIQFLRPGQSSMKSLPGFENRIKAMESEERQKRRLPELPDEASEGTLL